MCFKNIKIKKISRIIFSVKDPDKRVNGKGKKILEKNKLEVVSGILKKKIRKTLPRLFFK